MLQRDGYRRVVMAGKTDASGLNIRLAERWRQPWMSFMQSIECEDLHRKPSTG
jgi:hypothetical protein